MFPDAQGRYWAELGDIWIEDSQGYPIYAKEDGSPFMSEYEAQDHIRDVLHGEDEVNYFGQARYEIQHDTEFNRTDDIIRGVWRGDLGDGNHDGVIFLSVCDPYECIDEFILRIPENIKSATRNNGEYFESPEIHKQAMTAHADTLKARLKNTSPRDIDINSTTAQNFVSDQYTERFNQLMYHCTGHIILGNGFDLKYLGSGEGTCYRGWGIYLGGAHGVGEFYRKFGTPIPVLPMKDSTKYRYDDLVARKRNLKYASPTIVPFFPRTRVSVIFWSANAIPHKQNAHNTISNTAKFLCFIE